MNVRIENQNLRFKISEEELAQLMTGHALHVSIPLLDKTLITTINPNGHGTVMEGKLVLDQSEVYLNVLVPPADVQKLSDIGRSRRGLEHQVGDLVINLQVDVRSDTRKTSKA